jgi:predicted MFS family arabinose efflux permease
MRTIGSGVMPLGALLGGVLGTWLGLRSTLWITASGALVASLWLVATPTAAGEEPAAGELPARV